MPNEKQVFKEKITIKNKENSAPYWLDKPWDLGMYTVDNQELIGKPETPRPVTIQYNLVIEGKEVSFTKPLIHRFAKRDKGEIYEPFEVLPKVTTKLNNKVLIFADDTTQKVAVNVRSGENNINGKLTLKVPNGWNVSPKEATFSIAKKEDIQVVDFMVTPTKKQSEGTIEAVASINGITYNKELIEINYDHIPKQSVLLASKAKVVRLDIKKEGKLIGYIQGSGDAVPESLRQIGYEVKEIKPSEINDKNLQQFDAVVLGIRAYNTQKELEFKQKHLLAYVEQGGNMIVQYNTNRRVDIQAPYKLELSRDRVTDENAKVTFLAKDHTLLNFPNKITTNDFEGWVQERGLYFPNKWGEEFTPILAMKDKGEGSKKGSILIAKHGKGNYIYTGISFFRELPVGVSGAYKLFANMLSVPKN